MKRRRHTHLALSGGGVSDAACGSTAPALRAATARVYEISAAATSERVLITCPRCVAYAQRTRADAVVRPTSYKPMFQVDGQWYGNAQRFATREEAHASARARFMVWTIPTACDVHESTDAVNYAHIDGRDEVTEITDVAFEDDADVNSIGLRLHPIDVGFDLRGDGMAVYIPYAPTMRVSYATRTGERRVVSGPQPAVVRHLSEAGYHIEGGLAFKYGGIR